MDSGILPTVLLVIQAAWRKDLKATSADFVYGEPLRLPGEFLIESKRTEDTSSFLRELRSFFNQLQPVAPKRFGDPIETSHLIITWPSHDYHDIITGK